MHWLFLCAVSVFALQFVHSKYVLIDDYSGTNFEDMFEFYANGNTNGGFNNYLDKQSATSKGLYHLLPNNSVYIGVDNITIATNPRGRDSILIYSKIAYNYGLFIFDIAHMPGSVCGTWPKFSLSGESPAFPVYGIIQVIEGVNKFTNNLMSLHTEDGCVVTNSSDQFTGHLSSSNCYINADGQGTNQGCQIYADRTNTYGTDFNNAGGGVYAMEWSSISIKIWQFLRNQIPEDIENKRPTPGKWPTPLAKFFGDGCNFDQKFHNQIIVIDSIFCGGWGYGEFSTNPACDDHLPPANLQTSTVPSKKPETTAKSTVTNSLTTFHASSTKRTTLMPLATAKTDPFVYIGLSIALIMNVLISFCLIFLWCKQKRQRGASFYTFMNSFLRKPERHHVEEETEDLWQLRRENVIVYYDKRLGKGDFADVYVGRLIGNAGIKLMFKDLLAISNFHDCIVAIKTLPIESNDAAKDDFQKEITFMKSLKYHPNLLCLLGYVPDIENPLLVLEFCSMDLLRFLREQKMQIEQDVQIKQLLSFSWQISNGLNYFTSLGYIHRDIAARNVLLQNNVCKICDYGLCRSINSEIYISRTVKMPVRWAAIESLRSGEYSMKSDVWSYAILLFEMFSLGAIPYPSLTNGDILSFLESGQRLQKPVYCSDEVYALMIKCWQTDPSNRPTFSEISQHLTRIIEQATLDDEYLRVIKYQNDLMEDTVSIYE